MPSQVDQQLAVENRRLWLRIEELEAQQRRKQFDQIELDQLYLNAPVGLCLVDSDLRFVRINQRLADINGLSIDEHLGAMVQDVVPQIWETIGPIYTRVLETGEAAMDFEVVGVAPIASDRDSTFLVSYYPVKNDHGRVIGVSTVVQDISARKQAEQELHESQTSLRTLVDHAPEAIVVLDTDTGKFVDWNPNAVLLFDLDAQQMAGAGLNDISPSTQPNGEPSDEMAKRRVAQALAGEAPVFGWNHLRGDGREVPCEVRLVRLPARERNLVRGRITNVTARKKAEAALRQAHTKLEDRVARRTADLAKSREQWRSLVAAAPDLILTVNPDGTLRYINRIEPGFELDDVIGSSAYDYVRPEFREPMRSCVESVLETGQVRGIELSADMPDGSVIWYSSRMGPLLEGDQTIGVMIIATDITSRKEDELFLRQLLDLQERERHMIAHDIHDGIVQEIVGAKMHLGAAVAKLDEDDPTAAALVKIDQGLAAAIAEGRRLMSDVRPLIIDDEGIVEAIEYLIADLRIQSEMEFEFDHDVETVQYDSRLQGALFRIAQEALTNARRHSQADHVAIQLIQANGVLDLTVEDQGVGFDPLKVSAERFGLRGIRERATF